MAERVGFEPTIPVKVCPLSRRIVSTTHAPLRAKIRTKNLGLLDYTFALRLLKKLCSKPAHSSASTPGTTSI